jgi:ATPase family associated with various cellular activities (AAA)
MNLTEQFNRARIAGVPLVAINTPDPAATIRAIVKSLNGQAPPVFQWDMVAGLQPFNKRANEVLPDLNTGGMDPAKIIGPVDFLIICRELPVEVIVFAHQAHRYIGEIGVSQAIWNLRDAFKFNGRTLVLLAPTLDLPIELQQDLVVLDEPLPTGEELATIVRDTHKSAQLPEPDAAIVEKSVDAICGLSAFPAEQITAMSVTPKGMDLDMLWDRKRKSIEQTKGLSVWRGGETFADIRGCKNALKFMNMMMDGLDAPRVVVWLDEAEKQFAGSGTDLSGVSTEMTGTILTWMQDHDAHGVILLGPPGSGKSLIAKCTASTWGKPTISFDVGAMKDSLVGGSNANIRQALKVVDAVAQGKVLFVATCNSFGSLSPEFKRRFKDATFYCDLPDQDELLSIWNLYIDKFKIPTLHASIPNSIDWTGAEVRACCDLAYRFGIPLEKAAQYIVPVCKSAAEQIQTLRRQADGKFISASYGGVYRLPREEKTLTRRITN